MDIPDSAVAAFIGATTGLIGNSLSAWVTSKLSDRSIKKAQIRDDLLWIESLVFEVRDRAVAYWAEGNTNSESAASINGRITAISELISPLVANSSIPLNDFEDACTGGEYQSSRMRSNPERAMIIELSAYKLIACIRRSRQGV